MSLHANNLNAGNASFKLFGNTQIQSKLELNSVTLSSLASVFPDLN